VKAVVYEKMYRWERWVDMRNVGLAGMEVGRVDVSRAEGVEDDRNRGTR
jgi:hypothetical protein